VIEREGQRQIAVAWQADLEGDSEIRLAVGPLGCLPRAE